MCGAPDATWRQLIWDVTNSGTYRYPRGITHITHSGGYLHSPYSTIGRTGSDSVTGTEQFCTAMIYLDRSHASNE